MKRPWLIIGLRSVRGGDLLPTGTGDRTSKCRVSITSFPAAHNGAMVLRKVTVVLKPYYQNAWAGRPKSCEICHLGHKRRIEKSAREASTGDQQIANALPFFPTGVLCGNAWSYLRLAAYSFLGLSERA